MRGVYAHTTCLRLFGVVVAKMKRVVDGSAAADYGLTKAKVVAFPTAEAGEAERCETTNGERNEPGGRMKKSAGRGVSLTKASVKKLQLPEGKTNGYFWDAELPGFG